MPPANDQTDRIVRAFIAVRVEPTPALSAFVKTLAELGKAVRPVSTDNLHITLRFLGGTFASTLPNVGKVIQVSVQDIAPFDLRLIGLGAFPDVDRPRVVWVGTQNNAPLSTVVKRMQEPLTDLGFAGDARPWSPHLTLARIKARPPRQLINALRRHGDADFGYVRITTVDLMLSTLSQSGATYHVVRHVPLRS